MDYSNFKKFTIKDNLVLSFFKNNAILICPKIKKFKYIFNLNNNIKTLLTTFLKKGMSRKFQFNFFNQQYFFIKKYLKHLPFFGIFVEQKFCMFNLLTNFNVFFKFSFHSINKKIRKFSRGRSGKYKLVVNYLPFYKRFRFILTLLKKNYKIASNLPLKEKIMFMNYVLSFNIKKSLIVKLIRFINYYIFRRKYNTILLTSN